MDTLSTMKSVSGNGDRFVAHDSGLRRFSDWLLALPAQTCCILNEADGDVVCSDHTGGSLRRAGRIDAATALLGLDRAGQDSRQARLTVGVDSGADRQLLWIVTPVEAEPPGYRLQVSLLAGWSEAGARVLPQLDQALANATTRHSMTQPLTALSFLLENLLYAFLESAPDDDYLLAKQTDLLEQVVRLSQLLGEAGVPLAMC